MIKVLRYFLSLFSKYMPPFLKQRTVSIVCFSSHGVEKFIQCVVLRKNTYVSLIIGIFKS